MRFVSNVALDLFSLAMHPSDNFFLKASNLRGPPAEVALFSSRVRR